MVKRLLRLSDDEPNRYIIANYKTLGKLLRSSNGKVISIQIDSKRKSQHQKKDINNHEIIKILNDKSSEQIEIKELDNFLDLLKTNLSKAELKYIILILRNNKYNLQWRVLLSK